MSPSPESSPAEWMARCLRESAAYIESHGYTSTASEMREAADLLTSLQSQQESAGAPQNGRSAEKRQEQEARAQELANLHDVLAAADRCIDPDEHPKVSERISAYLEDCERASCAELKTLWDRVEAAESAKATLEQERDALKAELSARNHATARTSSYPLGWKDDGF